MKIFLNQQHPGHVFAQTDLIDLAVFQVLDATAIPEDELLNIKRKNPNYAITEPLGKYFMLLPVEFIVENPDLIPDNQEASIAAKLFNAVGAFWHDHYISQNN